MADNGAFAGLVGMLQASKPATEEKPTVMWTPYRVVAIINSPSGRSYAVDTIRIAPQQPEQRTSARTQQ
jgi:hypothetical protein